VADEATGTPIYMAPEMFKRDEISYKADIWSLGVLIYELLTGNIPFVGLNRQEVECSIDNGEYNIPKENKLSFGCLTLMTRCLHYDMAKRIEWEEIFTHPLIRHNRRSSVSIAPSRIYVTS